MTKVKKIQGLPTLERKKRVAAYARVSSDKDAMLHSLSNQVSYYSRLIQSTDGWEYGGVYADEGLTGTKDNRDEFVHIINDAKAGKIDLIITKSISRFARNTYTLLQTARELKAIGVDIYFEEQNLHSISNEGEMILTLLASVAQEESRQVSENQKWRIKKDFEQGIVWGGTGCYGYRIVDRKFELVPDEAEIVREIFDMYIGGMGVITIAKSLNARGVQSYTGKEWCRMSIRNLLSNINYTGCLLLQKTYTENHLTKKTKRNKGEFQKYFVADDHEPIISIEIYEAACLERERRQGCYEHAPKGDKHIFTGLLVCGICGKAYRHRNSPHGNYWICSTFDSLGKVSCASKKLPERRLIAALNSEFGYSEFDEQDFKRRVKRITVNDGNALTLLFYDGTERTIIWKDHTRRDSWTPEMRERARQYSLKRYGKGEYANG